MNEEGAKTNAPPSVGHTKRRQGLFNLVFPMRTYKALDLELYTTYYFYVFSFFCKGENDLKNINFYQYIHLGPYGHLLSQNVNYLIKGCMMLTVKQNHCTYH